MVASDARFVPIRNQAFRATFPLIDADGDLVTAAAGLDSEVSKDGGTFADCVNEATEIATSSGMYFLDLTAAEMDADTVVVIVKTSTSGAKTTPIILYTAARDIDDLAFPTTSGRSIDVTATGEVGIDLDNASGALGTAQFDAAYLTAALIATDAIGAAELAADAVAEIADAVWDEAIAGHVGVGSFGEEVQAHATSAEVAGVQSDTDNIQTRLPAALVGGRIDSSVGAVAANAITAAGLAADVSAEIADQVWDELLAGHLAAGSTGEALNDASVTAPSAAVVADAVWDETRAGHVGAGSFGEGVASVQGNVTGSVASVTADVTVGTNNDKTGYALSGAGIDAILDEPITEPAGVFAWGTATLRNIVGWLGARFSNKETQTATTATLRNRADAADLSTAATQDDGTVFEKGPWA